MKKIGLLLLCLLIAVNAIGDPVKVVKRYRPDESHQTYYITFVYNDQNLVEFPNYPDLPPHWRAYISVEKKTKSGLEQIGRPFAGIYTDGKCYEDNLNALISIAEGNSYGE